MTRVVPQVQYVGWDVVIDERGPLLVEGNWAAGVYENKPSVTGIRTGKPRDSARRSGSKPGTGPTMPSGVD